MTNWQQILKKSITTVDQLIELFGEERVDREAADHLAALFEPVNSSKQERSP